MPYNSNWIYVYANGIFVLAEGLDMFGLGPIVSGGRKTPSEILSFEERNLVVWISVS
jgi:hypothetical protein